MAFKWYLQFSCAIDLHVLLVSRYLQKEFHSTKMHTKLAIYFVPLILVATVAADILRTGEVRMGSYGYKCVSECEMKDGTEYYWCDAHHPTNHYKGDYYWDYCSKDEEHDYKGTRCYIEHACGHHGYRYKWCYINEDKSDWGYCGYKVQNNRT